MSSPYDIGIAQLEWRDDNAPTSSQYDDIYFSKQQGLAETEFVFLHHNQLAERWQSLPADHFGVFTIAETGFGTGLNFLAAWQLWLQHAPSTWCLNFLSVEKHPLTKADLQRALLAWPQLADLSSQLIEQYPALTPGHHVLDFSLLAGSHVNNHSQNSVKLQLILGEAELCFQECLDSQHPRLSYTEGPKVDAWFLDGFAPAKNPAMWSQALFKIMAQLSKKGTTVATFTASGMVRRGLAAEGFSIKKVAGFGNKREMLTARYQASHFDQTTLNKRGAQLWSIPPIDTRPKHVAIIGGGVAGCTTALALAKRGIKVTIIERNQGLAQEASGNPQAMLYTKLSSLASQQNQFTLSSYFFALRYYKQLLKQGILSAADVDFCGLIQLCQSDKQRQWLADLSIAFKQHGDWVKFLTADQTHKLSGIDTCHPSYFLTGSGWISPPALCRNIEQHPLIEVLAHQPAITIDKHNEHWQIINEHRETLIAADSIVIANSHDAKHFEQCRQLPLKIIRGQTTELPESAFKQCPRTVICHEGYITPTIEQRVCLGATFDIDDNNKQLRNEDHQRNISSLNQSLPDALKVSQDIDWSKLEGRANLRCTSPDYLPLVGAIPVYHYFIKDYAELGKDANKTIERKGRYHRGLYVNIAHGSRGLTSTPLCSELLATLICNEPRPLAQRLVTALNPARFVIRDIIRGKIN